MVPALGKSKYTHETFIQWYKCVMWLRFMVMIVKYSTCLVYVCWGAISGLTCSEEASLKNELDLNYLQAWEEASLKERKKASRSKWEYQACAAPWGPV